MTRKPSVRSRAADSPRPRRPSVVVHDDGTVTCPRLSGDVVQHLRTTPGEISQRDFTALRASDRCLLARSFPVLRSLTSERTLARVQIDFVIELPLGSPLPSPQLEAVDSAALAIAGPVVILPGSRISVGATRRPRSGRGQ